MAEPKERPILSWSQRNREKVNARRRELYAANPDEHRARQRAYKASESGKPKVLAHNRRWSAEYRATLRSEMLDAYGGRCNCCGEAQPLFLQLDHVHNDGHIDRKERKTSTHLLAKLRREAWPKDRYQLLCANCNWGKAQNGGVCLHMTQEARRA